MEYCILWDHNLAKLEAKMNDHLQEGWLLAGPLVCDCDPDGGVWAQSMTFTESPT
jgi:hypothetical protein